MTLVYLLVPMVLSSAVTPGGRPDSGMAFRPGSLMVVLSAVTPGGLPDPGTAVWFGSRMMVLSDVTPGGLPDPGTTLLAASPVVVSFGAEPGVGDGAFCCAMAPASGNASKPVASNVERKIEITAASFRLGRRCPSRGDIRQTHKAWSRSAVSRQFVPFVGAMPTYYGCNL